jgi:hypothetical protein
MLLAAENDNSADDYRSVIDDLTIENKKLKERLRKYESMHNAHLEKDKLFEVKIHSLPTSKRKELEDTLRMFASSIDGSTDAASSSIPKKKSSSHHPSRLMSTSGSAPKNPSSSSTSNSRPVDSGYASMSNSGPMSASTLNLHQVSKNPSRVSKDQNIQSFLHDIPEGLLPKHPIVMTERQKKKLVVKRLEQIFTGKVKGVLNSHSQHVQQQEVSKSAARANEHMKDFMSEGLREASILPHVMDVDEAVPPESNQDSENSISPELSGSLYGSAAGGTPITKLSPDQRPTRPLDLDPDREQNAMDNVEYIRHLGLSTPQLATEDSSDAEPDADGWVYLNLLINMAQLHIMNVTPDFVRTSISELSAKFQLSSDGKRIRWRGGSAGTRLSSDSDSPFDDRSYDSGDGMGNTSQKRRKVDVSQDRSLGKFASVPLQAMKSDSSLLGRPAPARCNDFHYKPLFYHRCSEDDLLSQDDGSSSLGSSPHKQIRSAGIARGRRIWGHRSVSRSPAQRRRDDGPIVFYSGATFCTDLSSDRTNIATPLHSEQLSSDGYSNNSDDALGCAPRRPVSTLERTTSGSLMRFRPFKDYSKVGDSIYSEGKRAPTPEPMAYESTNEDQDVEFAIEWSSIPNSNFSSNPALLDFSVSGLGGTQPADHFAVAVQTVRTKLEDHSPNNKLSGLRHPSAQLNLWKKIKEKQTADDISERLASLSAFSPKDMRPSDEPPIKLQIVDTRVLRLKPSELPEPLNYYDSMSNSDEESDCSEPSDSGLSKLRRTKSFYRRPTTRLSSPDIHSPYMNMSTDVESDDEIDMLASLRQIDPENVAAIEHEFEMEVDQPAQLLAISSAATVAGRSSSGYSSGRSSD